MAISFKEYYIEDFLDDLLVFLKANLNTYIDQMNTDKPSGPVLNQVDDNAYFIQSFNEQFVNFNPFIYLGESDVQSTSIGPETQNVHDITIGLFIPQGNKSNVGITLLRYRRVLLELMEDAYSKINNRKTEVTSIAPFTLEQNNTSELYLGIGVVLTVDLT